MLQNQQQQNSNNNNPGSRISNNNTVCVAVRVRPQNGRERAENANICVAITPGEPQIVIGRDKAFTYDFVFDELTNQQCMYQNCVHGLLEGTFEGYNATVLAYGQTGSGKTYTMGTCFDVAQLQQAELIGIVPRAAQHLFDGIEERRKAAREASQLEPSFEVCVQFIELYNEDIIDLLTDERAGIKIHEDPLRNEIYLRGAVWQQVQCAQDIMDALKAGAMNRTTAATNMNQQSSRSHAIFTIQLKQTRVVPVQLNEDGSPKGQGQQNGGEGGTSTNNNEPNTNTTELEMVHAKFHFVDLAGSERLKRTGATGDRAKEGISINSGLLALGNVISALGGGAGGRISHVPYRDSKLTRLLQDSLGGNSRTLMIACASPSDIDLVETLNTLNYANRAKNIKNKVVANHDKSSRLITELRARIAALDAELQEYKQGKRMVGQDGVELVNDQYLENQQLQNELNRLRTRIKALDQTNEVLQVRNVELQMSAVRAGQENKENGGDGEQYFGADEQQLGDIQAYVQELETFRAKMIELETTNELLRHQNQRLRSQLEQAGMGLSTSLLGSPSLKSAAGQLIEHNSLIKSARADIARQKKALSNAAKGAVKHLDFGPSPKAPDDDDVDEDGGASSDQQMEAGNALLGDVIMEEEELDEDGLDEDVAVPEEVHELVERRCQEHDRLCGDLVQLQEDIDIKERLVQELEASQQKFEQMRQNYERKLGELAGRIQQTEAERDRILEDMAKRKPTQGQKEEIGRVREKYEKELAGMRSEHGKLVQAERENKKMQAAQSKQQSECNRIKQDLENMKHQKVEVMKRLKEENRRNREIQAANALKMATYEKRQRQQQNRIMRLEHDAALRTENLKRKTEEVQRLKALQKRRETIYDRNDGGGGGAGGGGRRNNHRAGGRAAQAVHPALQPVAAAVGPVPAYQEMSTMPIAADADSEMNETYVIEPTSSTNKPPTLPLKLHGVHDTTFLDTPRTAPPMAPLLDGTPVGGTLGLGQSTPASARDTNNDSSLIEVISMEGGGKADAIGREEKPKEQKLPILSIAPLPLATVQSCETEDVDASTLSHSETTRPGSGQQQHRPQRNCPSPALLEIVDEDAVDDKDGHLTKVHNLVGHNRPILSVHATETKLVTGSKDRSAIVWDLATGKHVATLSGHPNNVFFVHLLPEERNLALTVSMNVVKIWDLRAPPFERCIRQLYSSGLVEAGENEPCERVRANQLPGAEKLICDAAVDMDGNHMFTTYNESIRVWDINRWEHLGMIKDTRWTGHIEKLAVTSTPIRIAQVMKKGTQAGLYQNVQMAGGRVLPATCVPLEPAHERSLTALCFTQNALFTAGRDKNLMRFSLADLKRDHVQPNAHNETITQMCVVPYKTNPLLVTSCRDATIKLWDVCSSSKIHLQESRSLPDCEITALSANTNLLFSAIDDGQTNASHSVLFWRIQ